MISSGLASLPPLISEASSRRLNVLVLDEFLPYPLDAGKAIRSWHLLTQLAKRHSITLLAHGDASSTQTREARRIIESAGICVELAGALPESHGLALYSALLRNCFSQYPFSVAKHTTPAFRARLQELLLRNQFDVVHCEWTPYAGYMLEDLRRCFVVDAHNIETLIWQRRSRACRNFASKLFFLLQARKMRRFEKRAFAAADCVAAVSDIEANVAREWGARRTAIVNNGVDLEHFSPACGPRRQELLFLGSLDWFPNEDAIHYLVEQVLTRVRKLHPAVNMRIVGRRPSAALREYLRNRREVSLWADVADVRPFIHSAAALLVPLRIGGGTRIKIIEAMAAGCPVISTPVGCEGLNVRHGENILVANDADEFAAAFSSLLKDPPLAARLTANARRLVEREYSWSAAASQLESIWQSTALKVRNA